MPLGLHVRLEAVLARVALVTGPIETTRAPRRSCPPPSRKKRTVELEVKVT